MWRELFGWLKTQFNLTYELKQLQRESEESKRRHDEHAQTMERMLFALQRESDHWRHEHEKLLLRLENEMLKFERRLPPPRSSDDEPKTKD